MTLTESLETSLDLKTWPSSEWNLNWDPFDSQGDALNPLGHFPQTISRYTGKVIRILQFHISHQMRSYSSVKALCKLSYTCFNRYLGIRAISGNWAQIPESCEARHKKVIPSLESPIGELQDSNAFLDKKMLVGNST